MPSRLDRARRRIEELAAARDVHGLIASLEGGWDVAAPEAVEQLLAIGGDAEPFLRAALDCDRRFVRGWAAVALGRMGRREVEDELLQVLRDLPPTWDRADSFFNVWEQAACLLAEWRCPRAVDPLVTALGYRGDHGIDVREQAAESLGTIGDRRAVPALIAALESDSELDQACLTWHVVRALESLAGPEAAAALSRWRAGREG